MFGNCFSMGTAWMPVVIDISGGPLLSDSVSTAGSAVARSITLGWVNVNKLVPDCSTSLASA